MATSEPSTSTPPIQLNDTHPAIAVAELMRLLVDEFKIGWDEAWNATRNTLSFTNHTLMPEALESWSIDLFGQLLPRHLQIIYLINSMHLKSAAERGFVDAAHLQRISLIAEGEKKRVRMAHLAFVGSHHVNGVSALHTELLGREVFSDLLKVTPTKLVNKTNGISFRRWLFKANDGLTRLLIDTIGGRFLDAPERLADLAKFADDRTFVEAYRKVRIANKARLSDVFPDGVGSTIDVTALFDVHIKRIHEYKRQLLNVLEAIALYQEIRVNPQTSIPPRIKIIAGKAAPAYWRAKEIIKLANDVADVINGDPAMQGRLKMIFVPNYGVSIAERLIPAADLSEQISTAGMEASGTGNMKLALNGALTIGTLDGANIEIRERVGTDHFFLFGMTAGEVERRKAERFEGAVAASQSPRLKRVLDSLSAGELSKDEPGRFAALVRDLLAYDPFMVAADFDAYWATQRIVDQAWLDATRWWRSSILNTAHMSHFSSDRAVREYADEIWQVPLP